MASILNSIKDAKVDISGENAWEDIKDYTSVIITMNSGVDGSGTIEWADTSARRFPQDKDIIARESFQYTGSGTPITKQFDHRARWFRVRYDHSGAFGTNYGDGSFNDVSFNLQTLYKKAPTELKIVDDSANIVSVNVGASGNSLYTVLTDASGVLIRTTNDNQLTGEALYVHLADSSGTSLATTDTTDPESLFVALRDASNVGIDSTGTTNNALHVRPGDVSGNAQASTFDVCGAYTKGVALYAALSDNCGHQVDTTNTQNRNIATNANALYVHLTDNSGRSIADGNALPVVNTVEAVGAKAFDFSSGVQEHFITPITDMSGTIGDKKINLYNIFVYNDSPVTVWMKVYDVSYQNLIDNCLHLSVGTSESDFEFSMNNTADGATAIGKPKYNITVPGGRHRDLVLPGGATFTKGVHFRATTQYKEFSVQGPGENMIFLNGTYTQPE